MLRNFETEILQNNDQRRHVYDDHVAVYLFHFNKSLISLHLPDIN